MTTTHLSARSDDQPLPDLVVTRHPGAVAWVQQVLGRPVQSVAHLHESELVAGTRYYGVFPLNLAAAICATGAECWAISLQISPELRGQELTATQLDQLGARLVRYTVRANEVCSRP